MWPRLQVSQQKPHWLQVDFEHYVDDGDSEEGEGEGEGGRTEKTGGPANPVRTWTVTVMVGGFVLWRCMQHDMPCQPVAFVTCLSGGGTKGGYGNIRG